MSHCSENTITVHEEVLIFKFMRYFVTYEDDKTAMITNSVPNLTNIEIQGPRTASDTTRVDTNNPVK